MMEAFGVHGVEAQLVISVGGVSKRGEPFNNSLWKDNRHGIAGQDGW